MGFMENMLGLIVVGGGIFLLAYYVSRGNKPGSIPQVDNFLNSLEGLAVREEVMERTKRALENQERNKKAQEREDPAKALDDLINHAIFTSVELDSSSSGKTKPPIGLVVEGLRNSLAWKGFTGQLQ